MSVAQDAQKCLEQLEVVEDAYTRWMIARAVGEVVLEHHAAQKLSTALFTMFDDDPDLGPSTIQRTLQDLIP